MIAIRGGGSEIAEQLHGMLPRGEIVMLVPRQHDMPLDARRYLFCTGLIRAKPASEQTEDEIAEGMAANLYSIADQVERIVAENDEARICVIGSESGFSGSFDGTYAEAKRQLHRLIESKRLRTPTQQLVCIAPGIIADCAMTLRRADIDRLEARCAAHPKQRFLQAVEVARLVHYCLYVDEGYLSGVTIRMNGGAHTV